MYFFLLEMCTLLGWRKYYIWRSYGFASCH